MQKLEQWYFYFLIKIQSKEGETLTYCRFNLLQPFGKKFIQIVLRKIEHRDILWFTIFIPMQWTECFCPPSQNVCDESPVSKIRSWGSLRADRSWGWSPLGFSSVQFSRSVMSNSLQPHELQLARPSCLSPAPGVYPNSCHRVGDAIQPSHPLSFN